MKKNNPVWICAIIAIFIFLILNMAFAAKISEIKDSLSGFSVKEAESNFTKKIKSQGECPDSVAGNSNSHLRIKYFYSNFCAWCKKEEPILQNLAKDYGNLVYIEWFNIEFCPEESEKYKVSGVPTFVFGESNDEKEYSHYGFIYEKDLRKLICDVTGGC